MRGSRGFTLAEVLVVGFLGLVVLGLMMQLLLPSIWMFRMESARSDAQQSVLLAGNRLQQALLNSQMESIYIGANPPSLSFQEVVSSGQPFDAGTGAAVMAPYFRIFWYDESSRRLLMKLWPPGNPAAASLRSNINFAGPSSVPQRLLYESDVLAIINGDHSKEQVIARNVYALTITDYNNDVDGDLDVISPPIEITIECLVDTSARGSTTNETYKTVVKTVPRSMRY